MKESTLSINPAVSTIATGAAIGMCTGFLSAPDKYPLKKLLTMDSDTFTSLFPKKKMNILQLDAMQKIQKASQEYLTSGQSEKNAVKNAARNWHEKFKAIPINETLAQNIINKKKYLQTVAENNNFVLIRKYYTQTRELLLQDLDNQFMREYFHKIEKQYKIAKRNLKNPIKEYRALINQAYEERLQKLKEMPNRGIEIKTAFEELKKVLAKKRTISANKLYEITNRQEMKKAYKKISGFLPKARTRAAINGALLLSTLTAFGIIFFNPSPHSKK